MINRQYRASVEWIYLQRWAQWSSKKKKRKRSLIDGVYVFTALHGDHRYRIVRRWTVYTFWDDSTHITNIIHYSSGFLHVQNVIQSQNKAIQKDHKSNHQTLQTGSVFLMEEGIRFKIKRRNPSTQNCIKTENKERARELEEGKRQIHARVGRKTEMKKSRGKKNLTFLLLIFRAMTRIYRVLCFLF